MRSVVIILLCALGIPFAIIGTALIGAAPVVLGAWLAEAGGFPQAVGALVGGVGTLALLGAGIGVLLVVDGA